MSECKRKKESKLRIVKKRERVRERDTAGRAEREWASWGGEGSLQIE